jgi:hypothetical protein
MVQTSVPEIELFYSDVLMATATAKRHNHKLSEKGRRDRMKIAIKALRTLFPSEAIPV